MAEGDAVRLTLPVNRRGQGGDGAASLFADGGGWRLGARDEGGGGNTREVGTACAFKSGDNLNTVNSYIDGPCSGDRDSVGSVTPR